MKSCLFLSYSYSVANGRSGILDAQTSFIGCDHREVQYTQLEFKQENQETIIKS